MTDGAAFVVRLEVFHGPLDLLLTLIRRQSLDISVVSLSQVTEQYLAYLAALEEIDSGALAAFCEVAATLLLIKSRSLLPGARVEPEREEDADVGELLERLRTFQQLRSVAAELARREEAGLRAYCRLAGPPDVAVRPQAGEVSVTDLVSAFEAALAQVRAPAEPTGREELRPYRVSLADRLAELRSLLVARGRISFAEALGGEGRDREFLIVSFLAVLELLRLRWLRALQDELFGEIVLELHPETPRAHPDIAAAADTAADGGAAWAVEEAR